MKCINFSLLSLAPYFTSHHPLLSSLRWRLPPPYSWFPFFLPLPCCIHLTSSFSLSTGKSTYSFLPPLKSTSHKPYSPTKITHISCFHYYPCGQSSLPKLSSLFSPPIQSLMHCSLALPSMIFTKIILSRHIVSKLPKSMASSQLSF